MIECSACLRRYMVAIAALRPAPILKLSRYKPRSVNYSTTTTRDRSTAKKPRLIRFHDGTIGEGANVPYRNSELATRLNTAAKYALTSVKDERNAAVDRAVKEELRWLQDPLKLANQVRATLERGSEEKALALVRAASKHMTCVVAWNHILDFYMTQGQTRVAQKLYNEMKKRAQFPDSYSYNILLRGLADHAHEKSSVVSALSIYHSLHAPNSRVKPTIMHSNSALNVCARNNDMDALWGIASRLPSQGTGAADSYTFTIVLNAIRQSVLVSLAEKEGETDTTAAREAAIRQGRTIWADIIHRWRQGDLWIDEKLVCAMGRLLEIGKRPHNWDDILSLVQQTMSIPRMFPRLNTRVAENTTLPQDRISESTNFENPFDLRPAEPSSLQARTVTYATPGRNTLSLILIACLKLARRHAANEYWNLLTDSETYNIVPDLDNKNSFLRVLRQVRAARQSVDFVRVHIAEGPQLVKTYRIAMSTCVRCIEVARRDDATAVHAANELFDLMEQRLHAIDLTVLRQYVDVLKTADCADPEPIAQGIKLLLGNGDKSKSVQFDKLVEDAETPDEEAKIRDIVRDVIAVLDQTINKGVEGKVKLYRSFKNRLNRTLSVIDRDGSHLGSG